MFIEAHLAQKRWEKDGKKFQRLEVEIDDLKFSGRYQKSDSPQDLKPKNGGAVTEEDLPPIFEDEGC